MKFFGLDFELQHRPELDSEFLPLWPLLRAHQKSLEGVPYEPLAIAVRRSPELVALYEMRVHGDEATPEQRELDCLLVERVSKFLLWMKGGYEITLYGPEAPALYLQERYRTGASRAFDAEFMAGVYESEFVVRHAPYSERVVENDADMGSSGAEDRILHGCRIGFDAGGSDRKVSAIIDGEVVFSEEVIWHPKLNANPAYHYDGIMAALNKAKSYLPRVDSLGVSSAGVYVNNRCMVASLFRKVPRELFDAQVKNIYLRAAAEIGAPVTVANDGDVAALAGAISLGKNRVMGMAMGTSEAVGYINERGHITGWLNELAFAPVDLNPAATKDEWSGDRGCGTSYFSQDAAILLAERAGLRFESDSSPAEKLLLIQNTMEDAPERIAAVYRSMGVHLGHSMALYYHFYKMQLVQLMGRVMSGEGGAVILATARQVLEEAYPEVARDLQLELPDEKTRRVGQSVAAAIL